MGEYDELREEYRPRHGKDRLNDTKKEKQNLQEQRNMKEARDNHGYVAPLTTSVLDGSKQGKGELGDTLAVVQRSTASMGKFDKRRKGEEAIKAPRGKRHKVSAAVGTKDELKSEKSANLDTLERMMRGQKTSDFNADKAANYQQV